MVSVLYISEINCSKCFHAKQQTKNISFEIHPVEVLHSDIWDFLKDYVTFFFLIDKMEWILNFL